MDTTEIVQKNREEILRIAQANGATRVRVFGSLAHGTAGLNSDLDLHIKLEPGRNLLGLGAIAQDFGVLNANGSLPTSAMGSGAIAISHRGS